jgi:hypothetical protein
MSMLKSSEAVTNFWWSSSIQCCYKDHGKASWEADRKNQGQKENLWTYVDLEVMESHNNPTLGAEVPEDRTE